MGAPGRTQLLRRFHLKGLWLSSKKKGTLDYSGCMRPAASLGYLCSGSYFAFVAAA